MFFSLAIKLFFFCFTFQEKPFFLVPHLVLLTGYIIFYSNHTFLLPLLFLSLVLSVLNWSSGGFIISLSFARTPSSFSLEGRGVVDGVRLLINKGDSE